VPTGQVPSTGNALTGKRSPLPASSTEVTRRTKSGAPDGTIGGRRRGDVAAAGTGTSFRCKAARAMAERLRRTTSSPRLPNDLCTDARISSSAASRGRTPESAKKHACITVLM
jgi:hypothetical protein